jgi:glycosyltransferase involved in cell wall biosynthesis
MRSRIPRVAIISHALLPSHKTDTQQIVKNAAALFAAGLDACLIICRSFGSFWSRGGQVAEELRRFYHIREKLPIARPCGLPAQMGTISKIVHGLIAPFHAAWRGFSVVYTRNVVAALVCLVFRRRLVFETYRCLGNEFPRAMRLLARFARGRRFLGIVFHSALAADSLVRCGFPSEKLLVAHNGYDPRDMEPVLTKAAARKRVGLRGRRFTVVYTGNMQPGKGIESLIDLAVRVPAARFLLVGGQPADIRRLGMLAAGLGAENVVFVGHRPVSELSSYLYAADLLAIPPTAAPLLQSGKTVLPFKVFQYLAAGRPVFAAATPDLAEVLDGNNAVLVPPDDPLRAARALRSLLEDPGRLVKLGRGGQQRARSLTWAARAAGIREWLEERYRISCCNSKKKPVGPQGS